MTRAGGLHDLLRARLTNRKIMKMASLSEPALSSASQAGPSPLS